MGSDQVPQQYWNALLGITTRAQAEYEENKGAVEDGLKSETNPGPLTQESREWLESAMRDLVDSTDPSKIMDGVMGSLLRYATTTELGEEDRATILNLAVKLEDLLQFADLAMKFKNLGGFDIITRFLNYTEYIDLRLAGAEMLITMCENNPIAQNMVIALPLFKHIFQLLADPRQDTRFRYKLLGSVSAIARSHGPAYDAFLAVDGPQTLCQIAIAEESEERLAHKSLRVLATIVYTYRDDSSRADSAKEFICRGYAHLSEKRTEDWAELAYIRELLLQDVAWEQVSEEGRELLVKALTQEVSKAFDEQRQQQMVQLLLKKFGANKMG